MDSAHYRPVSNFLFLLKIFEKVLDPCLKSHLCTHKLHDDLQSACSTEIVLHHDIAEALDKKFMAALVLLNLSSAFNVIDHRILQMDLEYSYVVTNSGMSQ